MKKDEIDITIDEIIRMQQKLKEKNILVEETNIEDLKKLSSGDLLWCWQITTLLYKSNCESEVK